MGKLKKFCVPYDNLKKLRGFLTILMVIIVFVEYMATSYVTLPLNQALLDLLMIMIAFLLSWFLYFFIKRNIFDKQLKLYETRIKSFRQSRVLELVLEDFENGQKALGGNLIIGKNCLIGRNTGMIALYDDIQRIYQEAKNISNYQKAKEGEASTLRVVCGDKNYTLCIITLNELYEREVANICKSVNSRNVNFSY